MWQDLIGFSGLNGLISTLVNNSHVEIVPSSVHGERDEGEECRFLMPLNTLNKLVSFVLLFGAGDLSKFTG